MDSHGRGKWFSYGTDCDDHADVDAIVSPANSFGRMDGEALVVPTGHATIKRMIAAPTMRTPQNIRGTDNVRRAALAALRAAAALREPAVVRGAGLRVGWAERALR